MAGGSSVLLTAFEAACPAEEARRASCRPSEGLLGAAMRRASSAFKALTSSWASFNAPSSGWAGSGPRTPRHHSGLMYSLIQSCLWMADQNFVASLPAQSSTTCSPPGWSPKNSVRSYTLPCNTTQADSLLLCFFTSLMGTPAAAATLWSGEPLDHTPPFENSSKLCPFFLVIEATMGKPPISTSISKCAAPVRGLPTSGFPPKRGSFERTSAPWKSSSTAPVTPLIYQSPGMAWTPSLYSMGCDPDIGEGQDRAKAGTPRRLIGNA
mmetsp:Transcript_61789/g.172578  ORF Transcript_61789/g.172578 Transcript_61789/m.172578 type:complete len:267 (+) Transcript_61789:116-916(+)